MGYMGREGRGGRQVKIEASSSWNESPTPSQVRAISKLCRVLKIREPLEESVRTRLEARNLIWQFRSRL